MSLEEKIQRLLDIEAVKQHKARWCDTIDAGLGIEKAGVEIDPEISRTVACLNGDAARCALAAIPASFRGDVLIGYGDMPRLTADTLRADGCDGSRRMGEGAK